MIIDDKKRFVELVIDNLIWGNIKIDYSFATVGGGKEKLRKLTLSIGQWIFERSHSQNSTTFENLTLELYADFLGSRVSDTIKGELIDRDGEQKIKSLENDNKKLVEIIADQKQKLDQIYLESPDKKNIRGIS